MTPNIMCYIYMHEYLNMFYMFDGYMDKIFSWICHRISIYHIQLRYYLKIALIDLRFAHSIGIVMGSLLLGQRPKMRAQI